MDKTCLIIPHLSLGDILIINAIIRYYSSIYKNVYFICKKINIKSMINIFSDNINIIPIYIDIVEDIIPDNHYIYERYKDYTMIKIGMHNYNWYVTKSNIIVGNLPYMFFKTFYQQLDLNYDMRYNLEKINRNYEDEVKFYNNVMKKYDKYIFIHDNKIDNNKIDNNKIDNNIIYIENIDKNIPIFHPNINYYDEISIYHDKWLNIISDNILDYCKIIENAEEIHLIFSSFLNLCMYLDLSKVKKKYIYTNIINIKDLHKNMHDWNIIYNN